MSYDDEGYILWSLRSYIADGGLYARVYSQYGPFFYVFYDGLVRATGLVMNNDSARVITTICWVGSSAIAGLIAVQLRAGAVAAVVTTALTFASLTAMRAEPGHPGGLLALLTAAGSLAVVRAIIHERAGGWFLAAALGAAMALTKINVGGLFLLAIGLWAWMGLTSGRAGSIWPVALACVATPAVLMHALWPAGWVIIFSAIFVCCGLAVTLTLHRARLPAFTGKTASGLIIGAGVTSLVTASLVLLRGTSVAELFEGVILGPLRHPGAFHLPVRWPAWAPVLAAVSAALALLLHLPAFAYRRTPVVAALRLLVGCWFLAQARVDEAETLAIFNFKIGPALLWLIVCPLSASATAVDRARACVAWIFLWQTLQVYPVAGSQMGWSSFLWVPVALSAFREAANYWIGRARAHPWVGHGVSAVMLAAAATAVLMLVGPAVHYYRSDRPLNLPGAEALRLPRGFADQLQIITRNIQLHGGMLFSLPGMFSFNLWTGHATPTGANVTHWFSLLDDARQREIIAALAGDPRALIVVHAPHLQYLKDRGMEPSGPLRDYLDSAFEPVVRLYAYELWAKQGRTLTPVGTGRLQRAATANSWRLEFYTDQGGVPATLEWQRSSEPYLRHFVLHPTVEQPWRATPVAANGSPVGPETLLDGTTPLPSLACVAVEFTVPPDLLFPEEPHLILRDAEGVVIDRLRLQR